MKDDEPSVHPSHSSSNYFPTHCISGQKKRHESATGRRIFGKNLFGISKASPTFQSHTIRVWHIYLYIWLIFMIFTCRQKYQSHGSYGNGMRVGIPVPKPPDSRHTRSRQHAARSEHRLLSDDRQIHVGPVCKRLAGFLL